MPKEGFEILAEIASSQNNTNDVRTYLKQAANTKVGFGYLCKSCGYDNGINDILCPSCNDIGTISGVIIIIRNNLLPQQALKKLYNFKISK